MAIGGGRKLKKKDGGNKLKCSCYRNLGALQKSNGCSYRKYGRYRHGKEENKNFLSSFPPNVAAFTIFMFVFLVFYACIYYAPISKIENQFLLCMF